MQERTHTTVLAVILVISVTLLAGVMGHGYMTDPPNRSSLWRYGYNMPPNYEDNQNFCGGFAKQWQKYDGECGPCGDGMDVARPRPNENTGYYGRGIVVRRYRAGQEITVGVTVTANHLGYFQFSVCRLNATTQLEENACFQNLQLANGAGTDFRITTSAVGPYTARVRLPVGIIGNRVVLRWHYNTGNSWGICPNGTGAMGCGAQEQFRSCSDIAIDP